MTRKYYRFIADYLIEVKASVNNVEFVAEMLQATGNNFDKEKFLSYIYKRGKNE